MPRATFSRSLAVPVLAALVALPSCDCRVSDSSDPSDTQPSWEPAQTVVVVTIDSLSPRILMGESWDWDVAPAMHAVFEDSVLLPQVLTPAGTTRPALASLLTGLYPQQHGARTNASDLRDGTTLMRRFEDAGYHTYGFTSNQCPIIQDGDVDEYYCTWNSELSGTYSLEERDQYLLDELNSSLALIPDDEPVFVWLHLNNVHHPYIADRGRAEEFYGGTYNGFLNPADDDMVAEVTLGNLSITADELRYLDAAYAAQLATTDEQIDSLLETLRNTGRYDDAIIVLGADHGEELAEHRDNNYFWHGCSPYNSVLQVVYAVRAPGRIQGGQVLDAWVGLTDLAPTIVELAGAFDWEGEQPGASLVPYFMGGAAPDAAVFSGRGTSTAVMIQGDHKYLLSDTDSFGGCEPYSGTSMGYPSGRVELYDLSLDPDEEIDLVSSDTAVANEMHTALCEWMVQIGWVPEDQTDTNILNIECQQWLCDTGSEYCED